MSKKHKKEFQDIIHDLENIEQQCYIFNKTSYLMDMYEYCKIYLLIIYAFMKMKSYGIPVNEDIELGSLLVYPYDRNEIEDTIHTYSWGERDVSERYCERAYDFMQEIRIATDVSAYLDSTKLWYDGECSRVNAVSVINRIILEIWFGNRDQFPVQYFDGISDYMEAIDASDNEELNYELLCMMYNRAMCTGELDELIDTVYYDEGLYHEAVDQKQCGTMTYGNVIMVKSKKLGVIYNVLSTKKSSGILDKMEQLLYDAIYDSFSMLSVFKDGHFFLGGHCYGNEIAYVAGVGYNAEPGYTVDWADYSPLFPLYYILLERACVLFDKFQYGGKYLEKENA